jgi:phosphoribosylanthranilate isomerase
MSKLWVKVCGMTTPEGIAAAADAGADAVGFVFYAASPRHLTIEHAVELQDCVPRGLQRVAVFLHPVPALVHSVISAVRPDCVQIDLEDLAALELPQTLSVLPVIRSGAARLAPARLPARVLLESARSGHGVPADWDEARAVSARHEVVLAGGLTVDNVAAAVRAVHPFGVDVSSGVESSRGVKDPKLIREFVAAAREAGTRDTVA